MLLNSADGHSAQNSSTFDSTDMTIRAWALNISPIFSRVEPAKMADGHRLRAERPYSHMIRLPVWVFGKPSRANWPPEKAYAPVGDVHVRAQAPSRALSECARV